MKVNVINFGYGRIDINFFALFKGKETLVPLKDLCKPHHLFKLHSKHLLVTDLQGRIVHMGICVPENRKVLAIQKNCIINASLRAGLRLDLDGPQVKDTVIVKDEEDNDVTTTVLRHVVKEKDGIFYFTGTNQVLPFRRDEVPEGTKLPTVYEMTKDAVKPPMIPEISETELRDEADMSKLEKQVNRLNLDTGKSSKPAKMAEMEAELSVVTSDEDLVEEDSYDTEEDTPSEDTLPKESEPVVADSNDTSIIEKDDLDIDLTNLEGLEE